jgi:hypothetical protein
MQFYRLSSVLHKTHQQLVPLDLFYSKGQITIMLKISIENTSMFHSISFISDIRVFKSLVNILGLLAKNSYLGKMSPEISVDSQDKISGLISYRLYT